jgi:hypothetical protein
VLAVLPVELELDLGFAGEADDRCLQLDLRLLLVRKGDLLAGLRLVGLGLAYATGVGDP